MTRGETRLLRLLLAPPAVWLAAFFLVPLFIVLAISFATRGLYGGIEWVPTLENYAVILDPLYLGVYWRSFWLASLATMLCLVLGFPLAYYMARASPRVQTLWLFVVMLPFLTNFLVRTYAWMFILRTEGLLNTVLQKIGIVSHPITILYTDSAVLIGLVYGYLPFMVLPLYAVLGRLDYTLIEAAWDLYASGWCVFRRIILPLARPGVVAGSILVFVPTLGAYLTPDLLGGARSMMVGTLIQHEFLVVRDWPLGSAFAFVLMATVLAGFVGVLKVRNSFTRQSSSVNRNDMF
jgi:spermidine/putrescine transport system permease protein